MNKFDLLAFEDLKISKMVKKKDDKDKNRKISRYTADGIMKACWTQLLNFTTYKVQETGKRLKIVNPSNTSKMCFQCKKINKNLGDKEIFICPNCDYQEDRDINASKNILYKAQKKLKLNRLGTETCLPLLSERV